MYMGLAAAVYRIGMGGRGGGVAISGPLEGVGPESHDFLGPERSAAPPSFFWIQNNKLCIKN
jgi:hypothetical protein